MNEVIRYGIHDNLYPYTCVLSLRNIIRNTKVNNMSKVFIRTYIYDLFICMYSGFQSGWNTFTPITYKMTSYHL